MVMKHLFGELESFCLAPLEGGIIHLTGSPMAPKSPIDELPEPYRTSAYQFRNSCLAEGLVPTDEEIADHSRRWIAEGKEKRCEKLMERVRSRLNALGFPDDYHGEEFLEIFRFELAKEFPLTK